MKWHFKFIEQFRYLILTTLKVDDLIEMYNPISCFLVVLAVDDVASLEEAVSILDYLVEEGQIKTTAVILIANKTDLVRNRIVSDQGRICEN